MSSPRIRLLIFAREAFPTHRPDVEILFGKELVGLGHRIDFVMQAADDRQTPGPISWHGQTVWVGATKTGDNLLDRIRKHWRNLCHDVRCLRLISPAAYDAVQVRDKFLVAAAAMFCARRTGIKFFFWLSWPEPESQLLRARSRTARYPFLSLIRGHVSAWVLYRWILPRCDHVFVQSEQMKSDVCGQGADPLRVTPVPMGVDLGAFLAVRAPVSDATAPSRYRIGYLGVIAAERHLEVLVEMLAELREDGFPVSLLLVGDANVPGDRQAIEARASELNVLAYVHITGFLPRSEALERIKTSDICVSPFFPSPVLNSTSPTKLVEYLALAIPVIANDHPEQRLALRQSRAGICTPWGSRYFAKAARQLLRLTEAQRAAMGGRGRDWVVAHRDYRQLAVQLEERYLELLKPTESVVE